MKKLFRSTTDSKITGLCGGVGEWLGIDPTVIRLLVAIAALFSFGSVLLIYFAASIFVPKSPFSDFRYTNHYHY
ncbi:PspC domain-containing protein [Paenibacillus sp. NEAU-GSW1]|uniref:PspC domain-containing protein n=1 Tax=Paenibacillus sp. NEAU-GSW1 TaxID=2682486 RepID=UPI0012E1A459|nr:PspC domain-containing protein [Paenibacillus sp. NEAU-GSW1]MUT68644.1 PspC domain-containing protein [Paenibacillus sp. NEAU-GSW1]